MTQDSAFSAVKPGPRLIGGNQLRGIRLGRAAADDIPSRVPGWTDASSPWSQKVRRLSRQISHSRQRKSQARSRGPDLTGQRHGVGLRSSASWQMALPRVPTATGRKCSRCPQPITPSGSSPPLTGSDRGYPPCLMLPGNAGARSRAMAAATDVVMGDRDPGTQWCGCCRRTRGCPHRRSARRNFASRGG